MYNERRENFAIQDVILQISFVVLFVFLLLWLFPTKDFVKKEINNVISEENFSENLSTMTNAAKNYFTTERLPIKVGDKVKITLGDMISRKLIVDFDKDNVCDNTESYVEVTKMENEYVMKVNLNCGEETDYVLVYMGCYNYCSTTCTPVKEPVKPIAVSYEYQYKKVIPGTWSAWSNFGSWVTVKEATSDSKREETKVEKVATTETVKTGALLRGEYVGKLTYTTKQTTNNVNEFINEKISYVRVSGPTTVTSSTKLVSTTTKEYTNEKISYVRVSGPTTVTSSTKLVSTTTKEYTNEKVITNVSYSTVYNKMYYEPKTNTSTVTYTLVGMGLDSTCSGCDTVITYIYNVTTKTTTYTYQYDLYQLAPRYTYDVYELAARYTYDVYKRIEETKEVTTYKDVTYYRYQTRTYTEGSVVYKWSKSNADKTLLADGYTLTGLKREYNA